jgi:phosphoenolpyruvate-protein kinase (PTS system EI component)
MPTEFFEDRSFEPAKTRDGIGIDVMASVGCREDVEVAAQTGADGIGLCRTEQLFVSRDAPPSADQLEQGLRERLAPFEGLPVTVRLLDAGGGTRLRYVDVPEEDDPALGVRGARLLARRPDLVKTQLRALLRLSHEHDIRVLVPFVTLPEEVEWTRELLEECGEEHGVCEVPPVGAMVETPAAALNAGDVARWADFLSIETSQLAQFTMAASRDDPRVRDYFIDDDPSVFRLIRTVATEGWRHALPVVVCGDLAEREDALAKLLALGVRAFSVAPLHAARVKEAVRRSPTFADGSKG